MYLTEPREDYRDVGVRTKPKVSVTRSRCVYNASGGKFHPTKMGSLKNCMEERPKSERGKKTGKESGSCKKVDLLGK